DGAGHAVGQVADAVELQRHIAELVAKIRAKEVTCHRGKSPSSGRVQSDPAASCDPPSRRPRPRPIRAASSPRNPLAAGAARQGRNAWPLAMEMLSFGLSKRSPEQPHGDIRRAAQPALDAHPRQLVIAEVMAAAAQARAQYGR